MNQDYYWTEEWQSDEKEADEDIKNGRTMRFNNTDDLIDELDRNTADNNYIVFPTSQDAIDYLHFMVDSTE